MKTKKFIHIFFQISKIFLVFTVLAFCGITIFFCITTFNLTEQIPEISTIELYDSENNKYLSYSNNKKKSYVKLDKISPYLIDAIISIEDKRFYDHQGIDLIRIIGATFSNLKAGHIVEGGSTITQQYVRTLFLNTEQTFKRKIQEIMISIKFESMYSKEELLEGYLNAIYFDHGIYGVEDASIFYFNKHASELSLVEAACLASIPKGPTIYSPIKNNENNASRRSLIINEMLKDNKISEEDAKNAINEALVLIGNNPNDDNENSPFFQDTVLSELKKYPVVNEYAHQGIKVYTTLDSTLYNEITKSISNRIDSETLETAVYVMEPKTGYVKAIIGGKDYSKSNYNRAIYSLRQPGSTVKPFLYLTALENGFTPVTTFKSEPTTFYYNNKSYSPTNFHSIYANTDISMVYALATSDNMYAMKTHLFLGTDKLASKLKKFGFSGSIPNDLPSLALGTKEVSVQELCEAFSILANGGKKVTPTIITKITTFDGKVLYEAKQTTKSLANYDDVYILNEAMTSIFDDGLTYNIRPTGVSLTSILKHKYSAKSGSTNSDNWMIGYNPDICVVVWTGFDDNKEITKASDIKSAKYIWADSVEASYYNNKEGSWYETPDTVIGVELNPMTGFYPSFNSYYKTIYLKKDNLPWYVRLLYKNKSNEFI